MKLKLILEEIKERYSFFIDDKGRFINIKNKEHYDYVNSILKDFGFENPRDVFKKHSGMVNVVLDNGWIRGRFDNSFSSDWDEDIKQNIYFEFKRKNVSQKAIATAIKFSAKEIKKNNLDKIYVDDGNKSAGLFPNKAINILRK